MYLNLKAEIHECVYMYIYEIKSNHNFFFLRVNARFSDVLFQTSSMHQCHIRLPYCTSRVDFYAGSAVEHA